MKKKLALITGATGGVGKAFVKVLSERGYSLFLTGRSREKLEELRAEYPQTEIEIFPADLTDIESRKALMQRAAEEGKISLLVNVAGADIQKGLQAYDEEKIAFQCRVNFEAAVSLCRFAIAQKEEGLEIVNFSSVSGIYPMPYFAIYSATKGALTSFSQALRQEVKRQNVRVSAILAGAMPTREDIKAQIKGQGLWGRLAALPPEEVAKRALKAVAKNKGKAIIGGWNKLMRVATAWLPTSWRLKFIAKRWSKITKDAF